ncbi:MAG: DUF177 domain-containing protein [Candidatus Marinimicrobia bacterium]|nr:DUF177 domain-containing protein [Candidatus Neomarinimicrobiota bacterium]
MKIKRSSFTEEKQIVRSELTCKSLELNEEGLQDPVRVEAKIARTGSCLTVECSIKIKTHFNCDRCLDEYDSEISTIAEFVITSDHHMVADTDDMVFVSAHEDEVDISPNIREAIILALPYKRLCKEGCKGLCASCGKNLNEGSCDCKTEITDPIWERLKEIK